MKAIMISIKPKYVAKILNGEKTIEVRKNMPKCDLPIDVYLYCTKEEYLLRTNKGYISSKKGIAVGGDSQYTFAYSDEGMVIAKFTLNKVEEIRVDVRESAYLGTYLLGEPVLLKESCLSHKQLYNYLDTIKWNGKYHIVGYAWQIDNLEIFDEPKELSEFAVHKILGCEGCCEYCKNQKCRLTKPFQSWGYVEVDENERISR